MGSEIVFDPYRGYITQGETYGLQVELTPRPLPFFFEVGGGVRVTGRVQSFNPNMPTTIVFMQGNEEKYRTISLCCGDIDGDEMINDGDLTILWMIANYNRGWVVVT